MPHEACDGVWDGGAHTTEPKPGIGEGACVYVCFDQAREVYPRFAPQNAARMEGSSREMEVDATPKGQRTTSYRITELLEGIWKHHQPD